ncbi:MAG: hypothetical protein L6R37_008278 [Teloschistes peruensis]|nr:MAG: hypothetical protein L6R37_008278 [Teloschistes peruensis]
MAVPSPADIEYQHAHIHDDRSKDIIAALTTTLGFAIITVVLRFVSRHITRAPLAGDDWTIVAALAISASVIFYIVSLALTKVSILLLYRRIFPQRNYHVILWGIGTFVAAFTFANVVFVIFSCHPIQGAWNPFIKAKCINGEAVVLAVAVLTTVTDLIILGLPLPLVWKLHLPALQRLQLTGVFLIGLFATAISILRSTRLQVSRVDISYDSVNRAIWSGVEICVAIVCANLVILRPILNYLRTGKAVNTVPVGFSKGTSHYSGKGGQRRWTFRNVKAADNHVGSDGGFHRLEQENGAQSPDGVERQKYELRSMSPIASPLVPDKAHFGQSNQTRLHMELVPDDRV